MSEKFYMDKVVSKSETRDHIDVVRKILFEFANGLMSRGMEHDRSKLDDPELSLFAEWGPKLKGMEYGSDEYKDALKNMGPALQHHYEHNRHHPEFFEQGIDGMNLLDIVEMVADWIASSRRVKNGDVMRSLEINRKRFGLTPQLVRIIANTVDIFD